jgi:hypothetical protein
VQVVIALIVTPDGFPLAYEVMDGNTSDKTTLKEFLAKIEKQYHQPLRVSFPGCSAGLTRAGTGSEARRARRQSASVI